MAKIKNVIFHCSVSDIGDRELIREWHLERGWRDIGYNGVILNGQRRVHAYDAEIDGLFEEGRSLDFSDTIEYEEQAAHALGYNHNSIGICLIGIDLFTVKQFQTALSIARVFKSINPGIDIKGHYEVPTTDKTCPNFDMDAFRAVLYTNDFSDIHIEKHFKSSLRR